MSRYSLEIKRTAQKELDALSDILFARIDHKVNALADDARPVECKKLSGHVDHWRIRVGDYRIVYILDDVKRHITITRIAHRREVYEP